MKTKLISIFFFSFLFFLGNSQVPKDSSKFRYQPNFLVGVDVLNAGISFFGNRKLYQGFVSSKVTKNINASLDLGFESNVYTKNGYDATAKGPFFKLGTFYMLTMDKENEMNGFYLGGRLAAAYYQQKYLSVPVRGYGGSNSFVGFDASQQSSYWAEGVVGARIQLFSSPLYIDLNIHPKYLLYSTKQEGIVPMIVPGFGRSSSKFNFGFNWNIAYEF